MTHSCLVLNKSWIPVETIEWQEAFKKIFNGQAYAVEYYDDQIIRTPNDEYLKPAVIVCTDYNAIPPRMPIYSRRLVLQRDEWTCVYCGIRVNDNTYSIDHVIPRAQGGRSNFENTVCACKSCNHKKADKTPRQAGMKLRIKPEAPRNFNPIKTKFINMKLHNKHKMYVEPWL